MYSRILIYVNEEMWSYPGYFFFYNRLSLVCFSFSLILIPSFPTSPFKTFILPFHSKNIVKKLVSTYSTTYINVFSLFATKPPNLMFLCFFFSLNNTSRKFCKSGYSSNLFLIAAKSFIIWRYRNSTITTYIFFFWY